MMRDLDDGPGRPDPRDDPGSADYDKGMGPFVLLVTLLALAFFGWWAA